MADRKYSMYDWWIAMSKVGLTKEADNFELDRLSDDERLKNSGLPYFPRFDIDYPDFSRENKELMQFMAQCKDFMVRVIPKPGIKNLPRRFKLGGVYNFNGCDIFLKDLFVADNDLRGNEEAYIISITEYEENTLGGVIISSDKFLIAEARIATKDPKTLKQVGGLSGLCEGENPDLSLTIDFTQTGTLLDAMSWIPGLNKNNQHINEAMQKALDYLRQSDDVFHPEFRKGYFEWVTTKSNRIRFWDYKDKPIFYK